MILLIRAICLRCVGRRVRSPVGSSGSTPTVARIPAEMRSAAACVGPIPRIEQLRSRATLA